MFLKSQRWDSRNGQHARGSFLMLFTCPPKREGRCCRELRALVRYTSMSQCGHFMMGRVFIAIPGVDEKRKVVLSGTYGDDGLPCDADPDLWGYLHPVPQELAELYWHNTEGHNSAGAEGPTMHAWALRNAKLLSRLQKQPV